MTLSRRSLLSVAALTAPAAALAVPPGNSRTEALGRPSIDLNAPNAASRVVSFVAEEAQRQIDIHLNRIAFGYYLTLVHSPELANGADARYGLVRDRETIDVPLRFCVDARFVVPSILHAVEDIDVFRVHVSPAAWEIAQHIACELKPYKARPIILASARQSLPAAGSGKIGAWSTTGTNIRAIMGYDPATLAQEFTVDCLFGIA